MLDVSQKAVAPILVFCLRLIMHQKAQRFAMWYLAKRPRMNGPEMRECAPYLQDFLAVIMKSYLPEVLRLYRVAKDVE